MPRLKASDINALPLMPNNLPNNRVSTSYSRWLSKTYLYCDPEIRDKLKWAFLKKIENIDCAYDKLYYNAESRLDLFKFTTKKLIEKSLDPFIVFKNGMFEFWQLSNGIYYCEPNKIGSVLVRETMVKNRSLSNALQSKFFWNSSVSESLNIQSQFNIAGHPERNFNGLISVCLSIATYEFLELFPDELQLEFNTAVLGLEIGIWTDSLEIILDWALEFGSEWWLDFVWCLFRVSYQNSYLYPQFNHACAEYSRWSNGADILGLEKFINDDPTKFYSEFLSYTKTITKRDSEFRIELKEENLVNYIR